MNWLIVYNRITKQIEHYVASSRIMPTRADLSAFDPAWESVEVVDPPFEISRDHKVELVQGKAVGTSPSPNPVKPDYPEPIDWQDEYDKALTTGDKLDVIAQRLNLKN